MRGKPAPLFKRLRFGAGVVIHPGFDRRVGEVAGGRQARPDAGKVHTNY
jgi:hypothetical protein